MVGNVLAMRSHLSLLTPLTEMWSGMGKGSFQILF